MKISKLFHWLYAILMFLPILVFIPNAFYYGFNKEAVAQEKTEQIPIYYESNAINNGSDLIVGNIYQYKNNYTSVLTNSYYQYFDLIDLDITKEQLGLDLNVVLQRIYINTGNGNVILRGLNPNNTELHFNINLRPCIIGISNLGRDFDLVNNTFNLYRYFEKTDYKLVKEYQPLTTNMSITDSMSYAWKSVWQNDLFSWTNDTFLKAPFVYITDLFSIPSNNVLINALSYWLDISIIWLVFDVIMYVPLLTHRWLDKGIVE